MRNLILVLLLVAGSAFSATVVDFGGWSQILSGGEVLTFAPTTFTGTPGQTFQIPISANAAINGTPAFGPFSIVLPFTVDGDAANVTLLSLFTESGGSFLWQLGGQTRICPHTNADGTTSCASVSGNTQVSGSVGSTGNGSIGVIIGSDAPEPATFALNWGGAHRPSTLP